MAWYLVWMCYYTWKRQNPWCARLIDTYLPYSVLGLDLSSQTISMHSDTKINTVHALWYQLDGTKGPNSEDNMWCLEWRWQSGRVIRWWLYPGAIAPGRVMMQGIWKSDTQYIYVCIWMGAKYLQYRHLDIQYRPNVMFQSIIAYTMTLVWSYGRWEARFRITVYRIHYSVQYMYSVCILSFFILNCAGLYFRAHGNGTGHSCLLHAEGLLG